MMDLCPIGNMRRAPQAAVICQPVTAHQPLYVHKLRPIRSFGSIGSIGSIHLHTRSIDLNSRDASVLVNVGGAPRIVLCQ
jgi:hypothetical protein